MVIQGGGRWAGWMDADMGWMDGWGQLQISSLLSTLTIQPMHVQLLWLKKQTIPYMVWCGILWYAYQRRQKGWSHGRRFCVKHSL